MIIVTTRPLIVEDVSNHQGGLGVFTASNQYYHITRDTSCSYTRLRLNKLSVYDGTEAGTKHYPKFGNFRSYKAILEWAKEH